MAHILWWNVCNLFDDLDDPDRADFVNDTFTYQRDLNEIASVLSDINPLADLIGLGEVENQRVADDLTTEMRWTKQHPIYRSLPYFESQDPRGIDVACLRREHSHLHVDHIRAIYPQDRDAVRPVICIHARLHQHPFQCAFLHSKSQRSGSRHQRDPRPGSKIRFSYAHLLRKLALEAGSSGTAFLAMGDFNEEPQSPALIHGAQANIGRPKHAHQIKDHRLYNLSLEMEADSPGTHCYHGDWNFLDQILVNGALLRGDRIRLQGRPQTLTQVPLLYRGKPNRWFSDHLPISLQLDIA